MLAWLLLAGPAVAHEPEVLDSNPAAGEVLDQSPPQIVIHFAEELTSQKSTLIVLDAAGRQVDNGDGGVDLYDADHATLVATLPPLADGRYTVQWAIVLLDGDESSGTFDFTVGEVTAASSQNLIASAPSPRPAAGGSLPVWLSAALVLALLLVVGISLRRRLARDN